MEANSVSIDQPLRRPSAHPHPQLAVFTVAVLGSDMSEDLVATRWPLCDEFQSASEAVNNKKICANQIHNVS